MGRWFIFTQCGKHLYDHIISLKGEVWAHKASLTQSFFIEVSVPSEENEPQLIYACVRGIDFTYIFKKFQLELCCIFFLNIILNSVPNNFVLSRYSFSIGLFQKKNAWGQRRLFNNFFSCGMVSKVGYLSMSTKFLHGVVKMFHFC